jgi:hypothetical protein
VQVLATTKEVISQLSLVRIIKSLVFTEVHLLKVLSISLYIRICELL